MTKVLVCYYSRTGNTKKMAELIATGARKRAKSVDLKPIEDVNIEDLAKYDVLIMGSPTYYGQMAADCKRLLDESVKFHGKLDGKVGGAFSSSANIGGGNETTIMGILECWLIHGMVISGDAKGDHYGPVGIGKPDERTEKECLRYGERISQLAQKLQD